MGPYNWIAEEHGAVAEFVKMCFYEDVEVIALAGDGGVVRMVSFFRDDTIIRLVFYGDKVTLWGLHGVQYVSFNISDPEFFQKLREALCLTPLWDFRRAAMIGCFVQ